MGSTQHTSQSSDAGLVPWLRSGLRSPEFLTDVLQILKCVLAATTAWWVSANVLHSPMAFLAPWTALLTVHATVYRSFSRGIQTTVASAVGVGLSFVVGAYLGVGVWTFALAILVGLAVSRVTYLRDEGVAVATTAIFVLSSNFDQQASLLTDRMLEVALGVGIGVLVNLLLIPPLRDRQASRYVDSLNRRMGQVLVSMADELESSWDTDRADAWVADTVSIDHELESAWQTVRFAHESARLNPRRLSGRRPRGWRPEHPDLGERAGYEDILARLGEGVSHLRHLARTLSESTYAQGRWDDDFRSQWVSIVRDAGRCIVDPDAEVEPIHDRLRALATQFGAKGVPDEQWPTYGSLIAGMRHIAVIVDDVASARAAREDGKPNPTA